jgi:hypothetical protein
MRATCRSRFLGMLGLASAIPAFAAPCGGINVNHVLTWEPTEIVKGTSLAHWRASSVTISNDAKAPFHLLSGECKATFYVATDGPVRGSGSCARKDKDGDVLFENFDHVGSKGTSKLVGGTGKFANATGTFQYENITLQGRTAAVPWSGDCRL